MTMRIRVTSEQHLFIPNDSIIEVNDAYGKNLLDRNVGKLLSTSPIESARAKQGETAILKQKRDKQPETAHAS